MKKNREQQLISSENSDESHSYDGIILGQLLLETEEVVQVNMLMCLPYNNSSSIHIYIMPQRNNFKGSNGHIL